MTHRNNIISPDPVPIRSNRQKYHSGIPQQILDMAKQGMFPEEWCAELGISMRTLYVWANERPEFEDAVEQSWHALHAFWASLLRSNITNPAFRQTAALQVMAKRFPATWGQSPQNTLEHFRDRNSTPDDSSDQLCSHCARIQSMTVEELKAELEMYEERRKHDA